MQEPIAITRLGLADAADIEALFFTTEQRVEPGFLARRSPGDYLRILRDQETIVVGARIDGKLVGFSICCRVRENPYRATMFLRSIDATRSVVFKGIGTIVAPHCEGRLLSRRLLFALERTMLDASMNHFLGLVAIGNKAAMGNMIHARGRLVGLAPDEVTLNYVAYKGDLTRNKRRLESRRVDWDIIAQHKQLFDAGYIVTGLEQAASTESD